MDEPLTGHFRDGSATALDIEGVAKLGLGVWRDAYSWPVSDGEYDAMSRVVWEALLDVSETLSERNQDLILGDIGFPGFLLQHMHINAVRNRLAREGMEPARGNVVEPYLNPDWDTLAQPSALGSGLSSRSRGVLRGAAKSWILNDDLRLAERAAVAFGKAAVWALGSRTPLRAQYLAQHKVACRFIDAALFSALPAVDLGSELEAALVQLTTLITRRAGEILGADLDQECVLATWRKRLCHLTGYAENAGALEVPPETLLLTDLGLPLQRTIARALRRRGTRVVGFHHGNEMGAQPYPVSDIVDLLPVDVFVTPGRACRDWRSKQYEDGLLAGRHSVKFEHIDPTLYKTWLDNGAKAPLPAEICNVMIVGFPPNWIRYPHLPGHWSLSQLDVETRLAESMSKAGYNVLYKAHPEWEPQLREVMADVPCTFVGGLIEDCWPQADAFVYPRMSTTSFGFAISTNRPVILLDIAGQVWIPEARDMLARRCRMVPAKMEAGVRISFDEAALLAALERCPEVPDQTFVREAMCA